MHDISEDGSKLDDFKNNPVDIKPDPADIKPPDAKEKKNGKTNKMMFTFSFQLRTSTEGYNSGRQYIIQAHSDLERQKLVAQIKQLSKVSTDKFLAKSQFMKAQARILIQTVRALRTWNIILNELNLECLSDWFDCQRVERT